MKRTMAIFEKKHNMLPPPRHIAIIMDGNGRWAQKRGLPRTAGHAAGSENFRRIATYCKNLGVDYLTIYAFSTENWKRSADEVAVIMGLFEKYLHEAIEEMERDHIRLKILGDLGRISPELRALIGRTDEISTRYTGFQADRGGFCALSVHGRHSRSGADHPHVGRNAHVQFPAVAVGVQRVLYRGRAVARF